MVLHWPFPTASNNEFSQVDQGWDLNEGGGQPVLAITDGVITHWLTDPGGFGRNYPIEHADVPFGGPSQDIYYGHVTATVPVGYHAKAGEQIGVTHQSPGDGNGPAGHLEIGFADGAGNPLCRGGDKSCGDAMRTLLLGGTVAVGQIGASEQPGGPGGAGGCPDFELDPSTWAAAFECRIAQVPGDILKSFLGGHTLGEIGIRSLEVVLGGILAAVGLVLIVRTAATGRAGEAGRAVRTQVRRGRRVARSASRGTSVGRRATNQQTPRDVIGRDLTPSERRGGSYNRGRVPRGRDIDAESIPLTGEAF